MGSGGGGSFSPVNNYSNPNYGGGSGYGGGQSQPYFGGYQGGYQQPSFFGGGQYFNNPYQQSSFFGGGQNFNNPYRQPPAPVQRPQYNNPYMRGYGYDRPPTPVSAQSLDNINKSYAGDYNDYISGGGTESSFIASPTFQDYERDIIDNIGGLSDRDRLNSDLTYQRARSTEGSLYSPSAGRITSAIERRLNQLGPEVTQAEPPRRPLPAFGNRFMMDNLSRGLGSYSRGYGRSPDGGFRGYTQSPMMNYGSSIFSRVPSYYGMQRELPYQRYGTTPGGYDYVGGVPSNEVTYGGGGVFPGDVGDGGDGGGSDGGGGDGGVQSSPDDFFRNRGGTDESFFERDGKWYFSLPSELGGGETEVPMTPALRSYLDSIGATDPSGGTGSTRPLGTGLSYNPNTQSFIIGDNFVPPDWWDGSGNVPEWVLRGQPGPPDPVSEGSTGDTGSTGNTGGTGDTGSTGETGSTGSTGDTGNTGSTGDTGSTAFDSSKVIDLGNADSQEINSQYGDYYSQAMESGMTEEEWVSSPMFVGFEEAIIDDYVGSSLSGGDPSTLLEEAKRQRARTGVYSKSAVRIANALTRKAGELIMAEFEGV